MAQYYNSLYLFTVKLFAWLKNKKIVNYNLRQGWPACLPVRATFNSFRNQQLP